MIATAERTERKAAREGFTASAITVAGTMDVEVGTGAVRAQLDAVGGAGRLRLRDSSDVVQAAIFVDADGATYASDGDAILSAGDRAILRGSATPGEGIWAGNSSSDESRILTLHTDLTDREVTGTTSAQTLETITVPAGTLGTDGGLRIVVKGIVTGINGAKTILVRWGGFTLFTMTLAAGETGNFLVECYLFADGSTSAQHGWGTGHVHGVSDPSVTSMSDHSRDTTVDQDIDVRGDLADGGDTIRVEATFLEFLSVPV